MDKIYCISEQWTKHSSPICPLFKAPLYIHIIAIEYEVCSTLYIGNLLTAKHIKIVATCQYFLKKHKIAL